MNKIASFFVSIILVFFLSFLFLGQADFVLAENYNLSGNYLNNYCISSQENKNAGSECFSISNLPNDDYYGYQWYLEKIGADRAWERIKGSPGVIIAVIDTGVQIDHPDLKDNIWKNEDEIPDNNKDDDNNGFIDDFNGWDFINNTSDPSPRFEEGYTEAGISHGTIVSGIIAANTNNKIGVAGVTWKAKIMPLRVLSDNGEGGATEVIRAIDYAIKNKADIINLSFVGPNRSDAMSRAIIRAYNSGIIIVAAAGNEKVSGEGFDLDEQPMYPVCYDNENGVDMIIGVGGTDTMDQKANFSSYGSCVDIMAPGVSVFNTVTYNSDEEIGGNFFDKYYNGFWSGTSMSAPMVSGALALIEAANPEIDSSKVREILFENADNIDKLNPNYIGGIGVGRLNVEKSVNKALELLSSKEFKLLVSPSSKGEKNIKVFNYGGSLNNEFSIYDNFRGGINVVGGDINANGKDEIITGAGPGGGPHIRIFNEKGELLGQFFAYDPKFRGGVNVASGDIDGDGKDEIITGAGPGGGPHVRVFNEDFSVQTQFFAFDTNFKGGVNVASANIDGNTTRNKDEIIVSPQSQGGPQIRIFDNYSEVLGQFFAYDPTFRGGVNISAADINKDGWAEIITGAGLGGGPHVRIFDIEGEIINSFYAYDRSFLGGVNIGILKIK